MAIDERSTAKGAPAAGGSGGGNGSAPPEQNVQAVRNTLKETIVELQKTTWPTPVEANRLTAVVIGVIVILGLYMGLLDALLSSLDRMLNLT